MLILIYSHSDDFLSRHEYAVTADGHQCLLAKSDDEAIELARINPVDIIYLHADSIGDGYKRLMFNLNGFNNNSALVFTCVDMDTLNESEKQLPKGVFDTIFTSNENPIPFTTRLKRLQNDRLNNSDDLNKTALQTFIIANATFNWEFSCHADINAIRNNDILERITRGSQYLPIPTKHGRNVLMIISELYNNAVDHGILGLPSELKQGTEGFARFYELRLAKLSQLKTGSINISVSQKVINNKASVSISIKDSGKGFNYDMLADNNLSDNLYGRGIAIIRKLSKSLEYEGCGNDVTVIYEWAI